MDGSELKDKLCHGTESSRVDDERNVMDLCWVDSSSLSVATRLVDHSHHLIHPELCLALVSVRVGCSPSGCWSTSPHALVLTLMREHYYCVYLYMLCWLMY